MPDLLADDEFSFFVPVDIRKSDVSEGMQAGKRIIQGIASTEDVDLQDEIVVQSGIDTSYFLKYGYINDDHKPGPEHKVGEPLEARSTKAGLWIKALLYTGDGTGDERCDYWWDMLERLERSGSNRKVGFSIQGKIQRRAGNSIMKCWLQDVAITASPVNTHTWAEIVKSLGEQKWCKHPWKSLEKSCKGCPGNGACSTSLPAMVRAEEEEKKALSAGGVGGTALRVQSLEGRAATLANAGAATSKSLTHKITLSEAAELVQRTYGLGKPAAVAVADAIFAESSLH